MSTPVRVFLAILSGLMLAACFPPMGWTWLVWFWPWPILSVLWELREKQSGFWLGYASGLTFYAISLSWIVEVHWAGLVAMTLYLALYPAVWAWLVVRMARRPCLCSAVLAAGLWTGLEWVRGWMLTGFGWNQVGVIFHQWSWLEQPAEWLGSAGLAFPAMLVSGVGFLVGVSKQRWRLAGIGGLVLMLWAGCGFLLRRAAESQETNAVNFLLVQPNVPQDEKWANLGLGHVGDWTEAEIKQVRERIDNRYDQLQDMTRRGLEQGPVDLVVWPESSLHYPIESEYSRMFLEETVKLGDFTLALGCDVTDGGNFNSLVTISAASTQPEIYRKVHRVIFGEYIPFRDTLPFLEAAVGDLIPVNMDAGTSVEPVSVRGGAMSLIPTVCFESTVPRHVRLFVRNEPQIIVNVANDGWFRVSGEQEQRFWNARLRAIELRRPLVCSSNTGVSFALGHTGRLLGRLDKYRDGTLRVSVPVPKEGVGTLYARVGDLFAALVGVASLAAGVFRGRWGGR